jgi:hypothetical protein
VTLTLYQIAAAALEAARAALAAGPTPTPERVGVVNGAIAWDNCDTCGLLAIGLTRCFLSDDFPAEAGATPQGKCSSAWLCGAFSLQIARCAPIPDEQGNGPTVKALDASAQIVMGDAAIILPAVACALHSLADVDDIMDYVITQQPVMGPLGGCVGSQLDFAVAIPVP